MKEYLRTAIFVIVLLAIGYFLLPYVKINPKKEDTNTQNQNTTEKIQTFNSDTLAASFKYNTDQDADGKADTAVTETGGKIYVYYTASPAEQGQWVEKFSKDANTTLADSVKKQFLTNVSEKDCFTKNMKEFYEQYGATVPPMPENVERVIIAYPFPADPDVAFNQNADKCPADYSLSNGLSYFEMDKNHPDRYYFFSIGQYAILADEEGKVAWQDTFITK